MSKRAVKRTALVPFTDAQMYALVDAVEDYPQFLPWCADTVVYERGATSLHASIGVGLAGLTMRFATRNTLQPPERMTLELTDGPFDSLHGVWTFAPLGGSGCEVGLSMEFEFSSRAQDLLFGAAFEKICSELIDAFVKRAHTLYAAT